jgi:hypothetical protein
VFQGIQNLALALEAAPQDLADGVAEDVEGSLGCDPGIELTQRTGSGIPGIGKGRFAALKPAAIEPFERLSFDIDFNANLHAIGNICRDSFHRGYGHGKRLNRFKILCDILPNGSISPGGAGREDAPFVNEINRHTVQLWFHNKPDRLRLSQQAFYPTLKITDIRFGKGIGQTQHGRIMLKRSEFFQRGRAYALCRRIRCDEIGMGQL